MIMAVRYRCAMFILVGKEQCPRHFAFVDPQSFTHYPKFWARGK